MKCGHICYYKSDCCNRCICLECDEDVTGIILKRSFQ